MFWTWNYIRMDLSYVLQKCILSTTMCRNSRFRQIFSDQQIIADNIAVSSVNQLISAEQNYGMSIPLLTYVHGSETRD